MKNEEIKYHESRCMFAFINGHLQYVTGDPRDHNTWMKEEFDIGAAEFENIDRGNMTVLPTSNVQCVVYKGSEFEVTDVTPAMIKELTELKDKLYPGVSLYLYTGVLKGEVGDIWPPIKHICDILAQETSSMEVIDVTEDTLSTNECRKAFFTVALDDEHYVDIMISEESSAIYPMQNEDGTTVYDSDGLSYEDVIYDKKIAFDLAITEFEKEFGRKPNFLK